MREKEADRIRKQIDGSSVLDFNLRDQLDDMLRNLTTKKVKIGELMVFCLDNT